MSDRGRHSQLEPKLESIQTLVPQLTAKLRPLLRPTDAPPETCYTPSRAFADFVRCRASEVFFSQSVTSPGEDVLAVA
jgi:hypothetical protein